MGINKKTTWSNFCVLIQVIPPHWVHSFLTVASRQVIRPSVPQFPSYRHRDRNVSLSCLVDAMVASIKRNNGVGDIYNKQ